MTSLNSTDESSNEYCKYDIKCDKLSTNQCEGCGQKYCLDHYLEHKKNLEKNFEYVLYTHRVLREKLKSIISKLSPDSILDLIKDIYQFKIKSNEIEKTTNIIQQKLKYIINNNKQFIQNTCQLDFNEYHFIENNIQSLNEDIKQLKSILELIKNYNEKRKSQQQQQQLFIEDINLQSDNISQTMKSPLFNIISINKKRNLSSNGHNSTKFVAQQSNGSTVLSYLFLRQISPSLIHKNENELDLTERENEMYIDEEEEEEEEEEMSGIIDSDTGRRGTRKIHLSNNIIKYMRGPLRIMLDGTMHIVEVWAKESLASEAVKTAIRKGLDRQKQFAIEQQNKNNSLKVPYAEITKDWTFIGENSDRGYSSASIWMRDPQGRRILVKDQDHPLCAANEWLAYALGRLIGLPVNEVQIAIYNNKLVTLHTDVAKHNEKCITFMDLPRQIRKKLLTAPILQSMDLFDHIIQNVDRNPRNILITMTKTNDINDNIDKLKIYLIDHSFCFGMGKLNGISVVACKFHSQHLSVVKFDPIEQTKKFERYLIKFPTTDRILIRKALNRFAAISNKQFDILMTEIQHLLSSSQYNRIYAVLYRQRDIVKRYIIQWGIYSRSSSVKSTTNSNLSSGTNETVTYF